MNKNAVRQHQGGFTLIELIVVMVILGILAATALPRFANLGGDARVASLNAARGSLQAVSAMGHGRFLASANTAATMQAENTTVTLTNGYPDGDANTAAAAGLTAADYNISANNGVLTIYPTSTPADKTTTCVITYTRAANNTTPPVISAAPANADSC